MDVSTSNATMNGEHVLLDLSNQSITETVAWNAGEPETVTLTMDSSPSVRPPMPSRITVVTWTEVLLLLLLFLLMTLLPALFFNLYAENPEDRLFYFGPVGNGTATGGPAIGLKGPMFSFPN